MKIYDIIKFLMKKICLIFALLLPGLFLPSFGIEEITLEESTDFKRGVAFELPLDGPKKVLFGEVSKNEFSPILNFQGTYSADIEDEGNNFTYPFIIEGGGEAKFGDGKNVIRAVSNFTKNVDNLDNKFLGKLSDVYYERKISDSHNGHRVLIGNSRIPIGLEGGRGQYGLMFAKRAQIASHFGNARALGVRFRGDFGHIDYDLGGYSSTRSLQDITDGVEFAGRIGFKPFYNDEPSLFKDFKLAASINTGERGHSYTVSGLSAEWKYKKFLLNAEYAYADGSNASKYNPKKQQGFYAVAAYDITDKLQAAFRYDNFDNDVKKSGDNVQKYTAGLNYYVIGQRLRFSLNYTYTQNGSAVKDLNSNAIHFMTQVMI